MNHLLKLIIDNEKIHIIKAEIRKGSPKISLYTEYKELGNRTLLEYFQLLTKIMHFTLVDLIDINAVNVNELNNDNLNLLQLSIQNNDLAIVKHLLLNGAKLKSSDRQLASAGQMEGFLDYRSGSGNPTILDFCTNPVGKNNYIYQLEQLLMDCDDTTDCSSSEEASLSEEELSDNELGEMTEFRIQQIEQFNEDPNSAEGICMVAARGVHHCPQYFSPKMVKDVIQGRHEKHPTFSQSTLFDSGYEADTEANENDRRIKNTHKRNLQFIEHLKAQADHKEKKIDGKAPPSRNKEEFENLYYRFMQVYINSYQRMFSQKSIQIDFGFPSTRNPEVSASWYFLKGGLYGFGERFGWNNRELRKDPHYRRFSGKPKHPNMGYLDVYVFDVAYVRENGFDRQLMCHNEYIKLSAMFRSEGEIIFHSMIPSTFHHGRHILTLPSFEGAYNTNHKKWYGLTKSKYETLKSDIHTSPKRNSKEYQQLVSAITEKTAKIQTNIIEKTTHVRLFRKENKVVVHDHEDTLGVSPFKL